MYPANQVAGRYPEVIGSRWKSQPIWVYYLWLNPCTNSATFQRYSLNTADARWQNWKSLFRSNVGFFIYLYSEDSWCYLHEIIVLFFFSLRRENTPGRPLYIQCQFIFPVWRMKVRNAVHLVSSAEAFRPDSACNVHLADNITWPEPRSSKRLRRLSSSSTPSDGIGWCFTLESSSEVSGVSSELRGGIYISKFDYFKHRG